MKGNKCSVLEDEYKLRKFLSILLGIILGSIAVFIVETIGHLIFPPPAGIDVTDPEQLKQVIEQLPIGALIFVLLAWAIGSFVGGYVTSKVAKTDSIRFSLITGGVLMAFGVINIVMIPHPTWFAIIGLSVYLPCAYYGGKLARF